VIVAESVEVNSSLGVKQFKLGDGDEGSVKTQGKTPALAVG